MASKKSTANKKAAAKKNPAPKKATAKKATGKKAAAKKNPAPKKEPIGLLLKKAAQAAAKKKWPNATITTPNAPVPNGAQAGLLPRYATDVNVAEGGNAPDAWEYRSDAAGNPYGGDGLWKKG